LAYIYVFAVVWNASQHLINWLILLLFRLIATQKVLLASTHFSLTSLPVTMKNTSLLLCTS